MLASLLMLAVTSRAHAGPTFTATISGTGSGTDDIDLAALDYTSAADALATAQSNGDHVTLPVAPAAFVGVTSSQATYAADDTSHTITVEGPTTVLGVATDVLVVAHWDDPSGTPTTAVLFRLHDVSLATLVPSFTQLDASFDDAWLGFTRDSGPVTVDPASLPQPAQDFIDDSIDIGPGVTMRATVADGNSSDLGTALQKVGVGGVTLDGTLSGSVDVFGGGSESTGPSGTGAFSIAATIQPNTPTWFPSWLSLDDTDWTFGLAADSEGGFTAKISGAAQLHVKGSDYDIDGAIELSREDGALALHLDGSLGAVDDLFGADWLDLAGAQASIALSSGHVEGTVNADATIDGTDVTVAVGLAGGPGLQASLDLTVPGTIDAQSIATTLGAPEFPEGFPDASVTGLTVHADVDTSETPSTFHFTATGDASVTLGSFTGSAKLLIHYGSDGFVVAARPSSDLTFSSLGIDGVPGDPTLPSISVVATNQDASTPYADLDAPMQSYFADALCAPGGGDCADLVLDKGVDLDSRITLPQQVDDALSHIGLKTDDPLLVTGHLPLFGGSKLALTVHLPTLDPTDHPGYLRHTALDLAIAKVGDNVQLSLEGDLTVGIPRIDDTCPSGEYVGGHCIDEVTFSAKAELVFGSDGVEFKIVAGLAGDPDTGWQQPFGITWLTLYNANLELGVTAEGSVDLGFEGRLMIADKDITVGMKVGVLAEPPFIDFKGFTGASKAGLSMNDLASLYHMVSGKSIPSGALPPLGVKDLFLSFGHEDDPDLCLRSGFYLSGDLYIASGDDTSADTTPSCLPPPSEGDAPSVTDECKADSHCLASVLIDVSTGENGGSPGIDAAGYITGWSAGPLSFDPTELHLTLNSTTQRVYISGGGTLLDPITYKTLGDQADVWASGHITLDVSTQHLKLDGQVTIAGSGAHIQAQGDLSLSNPNFNLSAYLSQQVLGPISTGVSQGVTWVDDTANSFAGTFSQSNADLVASQFQGALGSLGLSAPGQWPDLYHTLSTVKSTADGINDDLDDAGLGRPIPVDELMNLALHGFDTPDIPSTDICVPLLGCAHIPGIDFPDIPGICGSHSSLGDALTGTPLCETGRAGQAQAEKDQYVAPAVDGRLASDNLSVPAGSSTQATVARFAALEQASRLTAGALAPAAATQSATATCAVAPVSYSAGTIGNTQVDIDTMGTSVAVAGPSLTDITTGSGHHQLTQGTVDALVTGNTADGCGGTPPVFTDQPVLTLSLDKPVVTEGSSVVATGRVVDGKGADVTLSWGDGSADTTVTPTADGTFAARHTYADDAGPGASTAYTVTASMTGADDATQRLVVINVAPSVTGVTFTPTAVAEMSSVSVSGTVTDPGVLDTHTVTVDWGDGTAPETVAVAGGGFTATHVYADDDPTGTPADGELVTVEATDNDGGVGSASATVTVDDVAPGSVGFVAPTTLTDGPDVFTQAGQSIDWTGTASDVAPSDQLTMTVGWGDGSTGSVLVPAGDSVQRTFPMSHAWASACVYRATVDVSDDDTLSAPTLHQSVVVTEPLGADAEGPGWWQHQTAALVSGHGHTDVSVDRLGCYLSIVREVSATFAQGIPLDTVADAAAVLHPSYAHLSPLDQERARLARALLTSTLNFAHGARTWDAVVGPGGTTFADLVRSADAAWSSGDLDTVRAVRQQLERLDGVG